MTKREKHEIAVAVRNIINDECDEIRKHYKELYGSLKGLRNYVRKECIAFWTDCEPYLDSHYLDIAWFEVDGRIINYDDLWCNIRENLKFDNSRKAA